MSSTSKHDSNYRCIMSSESRVANGGGESSRGLPYTGYVTDPKPIPRGRPTAYSLVMHLN
jgi:hypothetical protein